MARILVVDDEPDVRELFNITLKMAGHTTETAKDGVEAVERLSNNDIPDLILLDLMMPRLDGFGFLTHIREKMDTQPVRVLVATAKVLEDSDQQKLDPWPVVGVLNKGELDIAAMVTIVSNALGKEPMKPAGPAAPQEEKPTGAEVVQPDQPAAPPPAASQRAEPVQPAPQPAPSAPSTPAQPSPSSSPPPQTAPQSSPSAPAVAPPVAPVQSTSLPPASSGSDAKPATTGSDHKAENTVTPGSPKDQPQQTPPETIPAEPNPAAKEAGEPVKKE